VDKEGRAGGRRWKTKLLVEKVCALKIVRLYCPDNNSVIGMEGEEKIGKKNQESMPGPCCSYLAFALSAHHHYE